MIIDVYHLCLSRSVLGKTEPNINIPQLSESHLQLMSRRIPKFPPKKKQKNPSKSGSFQGSKGMVWVPWTRPQVDERTRFVWTITDTWEFFLAKETFAKLHQAKRTRMVIVHQFLSPASNPTCWWFKIPASTSFEVGSWNPIIYRVSFTSHQWLVVWDFWTIHSMFPSAKGLLFSSWWFNLRRFPQLVEPRNHGRWHPNPNHQSPNRIPGAWEFQPVHKSHDYRWWWDGWEMQHVKVVQDFGGYKNSF